MPEQQARAPRPRTPHHSGHPRPQPPRQTPAAAVRQPDAWPIMKDYPKRKDGATVSASATDDDRTYELALHHLVALRALEHDLNGAQTSEDKRNGCADELAFHHNGKIVLLQAKHGSNPRSRVTIENLRAEDHDFALEKYFKAFKESSEKHKPETVEHLIIFSPKRIDSSLIESRGDKKPIFIKIENQSESLVRKLLDPCANQGSTFYEINSEWLKVSGEADLALHLREIMSCSNKPPERKTKAKSPKMSDESHLKDFLKELEAALRKPAAGALQGIVDTAFQQYKVKSASQKVKASTEEQSERKAFLKYFKDEKMLAVRVGSGQRNTTIRAFADQTLKKFQQKENSAKFLHDINKRKEFLSKVILALTQPNATELERHVCENFRTYAATFCKGKTDEEIEDARDKLKDKIYDWVKIKGKHQPRPPPWTLHRTKEILDWWETIREERRKREQDSTSAAQQQLVMAALLQEGWPALGGPEARSVVDLLKDVSPDSVGLRVSGQGSVQVEKDTLVEFLASQWLHSKLKLELELTNVHGLLDRVMVDEHFRGVRACLDEEISREQGTARMRWSKRVDSTKTFPDTFLSVPVIEGLPSLTCLLWTKFHCGLEERVRGDAFLEAVRRALIPFVEMALRDETFRQAVPTMRRRNGMNPLHWALSVYKSVKRELGSELYCTRLQKLLQMLLKAGCQVGAQTLSTRQTALHFAAYKGSLCAAQLLLAEGCATDRERSDLLQSEDSKGRTAYHLAMSHNYDELAHALDQAAVQHID